MKYFVDHDSDRSIYLQLYEQLRRDIVDKQYLYGSKLPSKRILSEETGVSLISVEHAYGLLQDEGYIETRPRSGYYVVFQDTDGFVGQEARTTVYQPPVQETTPVAYDETENMSFTVWAKTMRHVLSEYGERIFMKVPNQGSMELRGALARYLARSRNMQVHPEQIVIGSGAEYLYGILLQMLTPKRRYAIEDPSYEKIARIYQAYGVEPQLLPLGPGGLISEPLWNSNAEILHISPFRSYPSGITAHASKRREYVKWVNKKGGWIIEDDFESEFSISRKTEDTVYALDHGKHVIYMNSFSKTISPSIRIAYMILPEPWLEEFGKKVGFYACTVPAYEQYVVAEFIESGEFERHINRVRRRKRKQIT